MKVDSNEIKISGISYATNRNIMSSIFNYLYNAYEVDIVSDCIWSSEWNKWISKYKIYHSINNTNNVGDNNIYNNVSTITICMTNGGSYDNVNSVNGRNVSEFKPEIITEILENDKFMHITFSNGGQKAILRVSCISSINLM